MPQPERPTAGSEPQLELDQLLPLLSAALWLSLACGASAWRASGTASVVLGLAMAGAFATPVIRSLAQAALCVIAAARVVAGRTPVQ